MIFLTLSLSLSLQTTNGDETGVYIFPNLPAIHTVTEFHLIYEEEEENIQNIPIDTFM